MHETILPGTPQESQTLAYVILSLTGGASMAAMLDKNDPTTHSPKVYPELGLAASHEEVSCPSCETTYTLSYGQSENRIQDGQNVRDLIRSTAAEKVMESCPHREATFVWAGIQEKWLNKEQARAAGI